MDHLQDLTSSRRVVRLVRMSMGFGMFRCKKMENRFRSDEEICCAIKSDPTRTSIDSIVINLSAVARSAAAAVSDSLVEKTAW